MAGSARAGDGAAGGTLTLRTGSLLAGMFLYIGGYQVEQPSSLPGLLSCLRSRLALEMGKLQTRCSWHKRKKPVMLLSWCRGSSHAAAFAPPPPPPLPPSSPLAVWRCLCRTLSSFLFFCLSSP